MMHNSYTVTVDEFDRMQGMLSSRSFDGFLEQSKILHGAEFSFDRVSFNDKPDICYFGCEFTYGKSVERHERWTDIVDSKTGSKSNNFALPGLDVESICNIFIAASGIVRFNKAIVLLPDWYRSIMPLRHGNIVQHRVLFPGKAADFDQFSNEERFAKENLFSLNGEYFIDRYRTNLQRIRYVAAARGIDLYVASRCHEAADILRISRCKVIDYVNNDQLMPTDDQKEHLEFAQAVLGAIR